MNEWTNLFKEGKTLHSKILIYIYIYIATLMSCGTAKQVSVDCTIYIYI